MVQYEIQSSLPPLLDASMRINALTFMSGPEHCSAALCRNPNFD
jgi:hypothetical protein